MHTLKEESLIIIRIWTSEYHSTHKGDDVGHISIEIPNKKMENPYSTKTVKEEIPLYVSLWPQRALPSSMQAEPTDSNRVGLFFAERHQFILNSTQDAKLENNRPPEIIFCFYSFDIDNMYSKFTSVKENLDGWVLFGRNFLASNSHSCSTLAAEIIKAGDIQDIFSPGSVQSIVSPDKLTSSLKKTKMLELEKFEETKYFSTDITNVLDTNVRKCTIS